MATDYKMFMELAGLDNHPIEGKTYSLFGQSHSTSGYYQTIRKLADTILAYHEIELVLETLIKYSSKKRYLLEVIKKSQNNSLIGFCLHLLHSELKQFTKYTKKHLADLPALKFWDKRLATTEEQYHLYMLEIELTNRFNKNLFMECEKKISLQPYCLQDFSVNCKAKKNGFDYQCRFCSHTCYQNHASKILKDHNIEPYVWMGGSIGKEMKDAVKNKQTFGIFGIACIPELLWGMRKCKRYHIPVIGLPLNANRCVRWFGRFYQNSIDLNELQKLITI